MQAFCNTTTLKESSVKLALVQVPVVIVRSCSYDVRWTVQPLCVVRVCRVISLACMQVVDTFCCQWRHFWVYLNGPYAEGWVKCHDYC